jgi:hypothetical protein
MHACVLAAALALVLPVLADPPPVQVPRKPGSPHEPTSHVQIGELPLHCPSPARAEQAIEHYLGRPLAPDDPRATLQIDETRGGYRLELHGPSGRHVLEGVDCGHLVELAASVAAVAIDPLAGLVASPPPSGLTTRDAIEPIPVPSERDAATLPDAPRPEPPPLPPALPSRRELGPQPPDDPALVDRGEPARPRSGNLRGLVAASGTLGLGLFPTPSPGFELGLGLARRTAARRVGLHVELAGGADFAGRFRAAGLDAGGDLLAGHGALRTCATPAWRRVELRVCGRLGAGVLQARGVGVVSPVQIRQPWMFAGAELGLAISLHRNVALVLELGASGNLLRPHVWIREPAADYVMPALSGRSRLGLEVRFL